MGLFSLFKKKHKRSAIDITINGSTQGIWDGTDSVAMKIAAVYRCVDIVSGTVASLGLNLLHRTQTGNGSTYFAVAEDDNLNTLLSLKPNDRLTAFEFMKNAVCQILLNGNAYIYPIFNANGSVTRLCLIPQNYCTHDIYSDLYTINDPYNQVFGTYPGWRIIHLKNISLDGGYSGVSTITYAANTLNIAAEMDTQQTEMFKKGSTLKGFISGDSSLVAGLGEVPDNQIDTVSEKIATQIAGGANIFSLPGSMKFNQLSMSSADMQFIEAKQLNILDICRFFGVHPDKIYQLSSTNYKSAENSQTAFMTDTLQPLLRRIENEMTVKLIPYSVFTDYKISFNTDDYYQSDMSARADYYQKMIQAGALTPNEVRIKEGRKPLPGGDTAFISCNVAPINSPKVNGQVSTTNTQDNGQNN
jgi:HK97 family phage portal protein